MRVGKRWLALPQHKVPRQKAAGRQGQQMAVMKGFP
jgi:hypothetical protein